MVLALVGDIGGTHTRLALSQDGQVLASSLRRFVNADFARIGEDHHHLIATYLATSADQISPKITAVALAVAGPVIGGAAQLTNLNWHIAPDSIAKRYQVNQAVIVNDLGAQAHALRALPKHAITQILAPLEAPSSHSPRQLVVGLGTGVNSALLHPFPSGPHVPPAESGHLSFSAMCDEDLRLITYVKERENLSHIGIEDLLSGRGLTSLHAFHTGKNLTPTALLAQITTGIGTSGRAGPVTPTITHYSRILGTHLADLTLIHLPFGGIYLAGGLARALAPHLDLNALSAAFHQPRRVTVTPQMSIHLITDDFAALIGCAAILQTA